MDHEELQYEDNGDVDNHGVDDGDNHLNETDQSIDSELESIKARVKEMEDEAEKIRQIQNEVDSKMGTSPVSSANTSLNLSIEEKMAVDLRSIYVGNVDYGATAEELEQHFHGCGALNRATILCNKFDGKPKGFAYIEFVDKESVEMAMALDESLFRGRQLKVMPKRTNRPGISSTNRPPRRRVRDFYRPRPSYRGAWYGTRYPSRGRRYHYSPY